MIMGVIRSDNYVDYSNVNPADYDLSSFFAPVILNEISDVSMVLPPFMLESDDYIGNDVAEIPDNVDDVNLGNSGSVEVAKSDDSTGGQVRGGVEHDVDVVLDTVPRVVNVTAGVSVDDKQGDVIFATDVTSDEVVSVAAFPTGIVGDDSGDNMVIAEMSAGWHQLLSDAVPLVELSSDVAMLSSLSVAPVLSYPVMAAVGLSGVLEISDVVKGMDWHVEYSDVSRRILDTVMSVISDDNIESVTVSTVVDSVTEIEVGESVSVMNKESPLISDGPVRLESDIYGGLVSVGEGVSDIDMFDSSEIDLSGFDFDLSDGSNGKVQDGLPSGIVGQLHSDESENGVRVEPVTESVLYVPTVRVFVEKKVVKPVEAFIFIQAGGRAHDGSVAQLPVDQGELAKPVIKGNVTIAGTDVEIHTPVDSDYVPRVLPDHVVAGFDHESGGVTWIEAPDVALSMDELHSDDSLPDGPGETATWKVAVPWVLSGLLLGV